MSYRFSLGVCCGILEDGGAGSDGLGPESVDWSFLYVPCLLTLTQVTGGVFRQSSHVCPSPFHCCIYALSFLKVREDRTSCYFSHRGRYSADRRLPGPWKAKAAILVPVPVMSAWKSDINKKDRPNTTPTVRAICTFAVYFSVFRPFFSLHSCL